MVKATQMWVDAAKEKEKEDNKGDAVREQPPAISPRDPIQCYCDTIDLPDNCLK